MDQKLASMDKEFETHQGQINILLTLEENLKK